MKSGWLRVVGAVCLWGVSGGLVVGEESAGCGVLTAKPEPEATPVENTARRPLRHGVFRFSSYPAAWTAAQETNRPILVYACSPACPHCVKMLGDAYKSQGVKEFVDSSFESVYIDRSEQPDMVGKLHLRIFPTTIVVSPNNQVIDVIEGYVDAAALQRRLQTSLAKQADATQTR